jgi:hypothetical protein
LAVQTTGRTILTALPRLDIINKKSVIIQEEEYIFECPIQISLKKFAVYSSKGIRKCVIGNHKNAHWMDLREWSQVAELMVRTDVAVLSKKMNLGESN